MIQFIVLDGCPIRTSQICCVLSCPPFQSLQRRNIIMDLENFSRSDIRRHLAELGYSNITEEKLDSFVRYIYFSFGCLIAIIPLSAAKVGSYLTYFQSKVIYFQSKVIGSENTAACSPSVSICNRAVGSWTKSSDLVQKIPLSLLSLPLQPANGEYENFGRIWQFLWRWQLYDDDKILMMMILWWWSSTPLVFLSF